MMKYNLNQRKEYLRMTHRLGSEWLTVFAGDEEFYSAAYWDLLTNIWDKDLPVRKTDALRFMTGIKSPHTAGKYIETAIRKGILIEEDNPDDARSKLLRLSPDMRTRLDTFFDSAVGQVRRTSSEMDQLGPSPQDP